MSIIVEEVKESNRNEWQKYIDSKIQSTISDCWEWRDLVQKIYHLPHFWFVARNGKKIEGVIALTLSKHIIFGRYLATAPFSTQGGFYFDSALAYNALLNKAKELREKLRAKYVLVRHFNSDITPPEGWLQNPIYSSCHIPLNKNADYFYSHHLRASGRKPIKKAKKFGFKIKFGNYELLNDFWYIISNNMKFLGSPFHSKKYLQYLLFVFKERSKIAILYTKNDHPVAGALILFHGDTAILQHAHILRKYSSMRPAELLWWSVIVSCYNNGSKILDVGRSLVGSGNEQYKMKWRPAKYILAYWYNLSPSIKMPALHQNNRRYEFLIKIWQRMPLWIASKIGPYLISGIL